LPFPKWGRPAGRPWGAAGTVTPASASLVTQAGAFGGDVTRDGGEGLGGDGDREVAGAGDLRSCDPFFPGELPADERRGQGRGRLAGVRAQGESDAGGVLARRTGRAQAKIGNRGEAVRGERAAQRVPQLPW